MQWGIYGGSHISFSLTDTLAVFLSEAGWYGTESFIFILYDAAGLYDRVTIDIESRDVNDPPVIGEKVKVYTFDEDSSLLVIIPVGQLMPTGMILYGNLPAVRIFRFR